MNTLLLFVAKEKAENQYRKNFLVQWHNRLHDGLDRAIEDVGQHLMTRSDILKYKTIKYRLKKFMAANEEKSKWVLDNFYIIKLGQVPTNLGIDAIKNLEPFVGGEGYFHLKDAYKESLSNYLSDYRYHSCGCWAPRISDYMKKNNIKILSEIPAGIDFDAHFKVLS